MDRQALGIFWLYVYYNARALERYRDMLSAKTERLMAGALTPDGQVGFRTLTDYEMQGNSVAVVSLTFPPTVRRYKPSKILSEGTALSALAHVQVFAVCPEEIASTTVLNATPRPL